MNILRMMVIGGDFCADDEVYVVRVADRQGRVLKKKDLLREDVTLQFD
jgi:ATP phosphoribosyltransferase regulatory subunit